MDDGKITLTDEEGQEINFYILEETELGGETYILVTDATEDEEEAEALILREIVNDDGEAVYETVDDDNTLQALSDLFESLLDDIDITVE